MLLCTILQRPTDSPQMQTHDAAMMLLTLSANGGNLPMGSKTGLSEAGAYCERQEVVYESKAQHLPAA